MDSKRDAKVAQNLYEELPTASSIRVLKLCPTSLDDNSVIRCTLHLTDVNKDCLDFNALSYTWGEPLFQDWYETKHAAVAQEAPLFCNDIPVKVTANLEAVLRVLSYRLFEDERFRYKTPYLWVDSLCINQSDILERNSQVKFMSDIYTKASSVISWLGPSDPDSEVAIPLIQRLATMINSYQGPEVDKTKSLNGFAKSISMEDLSVPDSHYENLARFYGRQYFFRCWVFQEIVLARNSHILCGLDETKPADLHLVAKMIVFIKQHRLEEPIGQALALNLTATRGYVLEDIVATMQTYRNLMLSSGEQPGRTLFQFPQSLSFARSLGCTDPRDKVYAILGMVSLGEPSITPDYDKSIEKVYGEAVRHWITEASSLDILSWVSDKSRRHNSGWPSWIGEFSTIYPINQQEIGDRVIRHSATGSSTAIPVEIQPENLCVLTVQGKEIDRIVELAEPWAWHGLGVGFDPLWTKMVAKLPGIYPTGQTRGEALIRTFVGDEVKGEQMDSISDFHAFKAIVRRDTCFALVRQLHRMCWFSPDTAPRSKYEDEATLIFSDLDTFTAEDRSGFVPTVDEARALQAMTCSCTYNLIDFSQSSSSSPTSTHVQTLPPSPNPECYYVGALKTDISYATGPPGPLPDRRDVPRQNNWDSRFSGAMNSVMFLRRLCRTEKGYLGLVPDSSEIGDSIWLLQGARVPYALRRAELEDTEKYDDSSQAKEEWEVLGDTYVHGVMEGEVWKEIKEEELVKIDLV